MKVLKKLEYPQIGSVTFFRKKGARHLRITVEPHEGPRVLVPWWAKLSDAKVMVEENFQWVLREMEKMQRVEERHLAALKNIKLMSRETARAIIISRLDHLELEHDFEYRRVAVRRQKTVWGSCSEKNNVNLNAVIAYLPEELMDYVILHELVHTEIKNHSKSFWRRLEKFVPNARSLDRELNKYSGLLHLDESQLFLRLKNNPRSREELLIDEPL